MKKSSLQLVLLALLACPATRALAELHQCEGVWTNTPCAGKVEKTLGEEKRNLAVATPASEEAEAFQEEQPAATPREPLAPRLELIRKLRKLNDERRHAGQLTLSSALLEGHKVQCNDMSKPYADCLAAFNSLSTQLIELNQKQERNRLEAERNSIEREKIRR